LFPGKGRIDKLVTVSREDTLSHALRVLREHRILAAPVLDDDGRAVYILSVSDIVNHILKSISEDELKAGKVTGLIQNKEKLVQQKIKDISFDVAEFDKPFSIRRDTPLIRAVQLILNQRAHRILTVDETGKPLAIITQSELVRILSNILQEELLQKTVDELKLGTREVITIHSSKTGLEAFHLMATKRISALPVVNYAGKFEGHISMSDIKLLGDKFENMDHLAGPITQFLEKAKNDDRKPEIIKCKMTSKLSEVLTLLRERRVHRVYIADEATDTPMGVIAHYDILKSILGPATQAAPESV